MAANKVDTGQDFRVILASGETGYASGSPYLMGDVLGIITKLSRPLTGNPDGRTVFKNEASAAGDVAIVHITGTWRDFPKTTSQAWVVGTKLFWDVATSKATTTASTNVHIGWAESIAQAADTTGVVRLKL